MKDEKGVIIAERTLEDEHWKTDALCFVLTIIGTVWAMLEYWGII